MTILRPSSPDIIAIGASAGGLEAIIPFVRRLPVDLPATVLVVLHRSPYLPSRLEEIHRRETRMRVRVAEEGLVLAHGTCLINPPDRYMMVTRNMHINLVRDGFYPGHCIDVLLNSLASCVGPRSIGIILSGVLKDGALALRSLKEAGGVACGETTSRYSWRNARMGTNPLQVTTGLARRRGSAASSDAAL
jgi:two-component system, chemotaxis family, protein-glutamate methylesterase/glutaminase